MKIRILDRILVALAGLLMLAFCGALAAQLLFGQDVIGRIGAMLTNESNRIWLLIGLGVLAILGCYCVLVLFRHRGRKDKFVMQKTENGELSISLKAMGNMVQKCLDTHKELNISAVDLDNQKGGLLVRIRGTVAGGVSIPLTVDALQQQIKQYVTACSGVEVKDIRVQVESSGPEAPDSLYAIEAPIAKALPGSVKDKEEQIPEKEGEDESGLTPEEIEQVLAEVPAPSASEKEDSESEKPVMISAAAAAAAEMMKKEAPQEEDDRPIHQRLFSNPEEPCVMPMPPEDILNEPKQEEASSPETELNGSEPEKTFSAEAENEKSEAASKEADGCEAKPEQAEAIEGGREQ